VIVQGWLPAVTAPPLDAIVETVFAVGAVCSASRWSRADATNRPGRRGVKEKGSWTNNRRSGGREDGS